MKRTALSTWFSVAALVGIPTAQAQLDGALPIPTLRNVQVAATVSYDSAQQIYQYHYTVANPVANTGVIDTFYVDIRRSAPAFGDGNTLTIAFGNQNPTFQEEVSSSGLANAVPMVPVGIAVPVGWHGAIWARGGASFVT